MVDRAPDGMSEASNPIYRHLRQKPFEPAAGAGEAIEAIHRHIGRHLGPVTTGFHEILSDLVRIDVHVVAPRPGQNHHTLVTSGMSDRPMKVLQNMQSFAYLELLIVLPPTCPMDEKSTRFKDERNYWPIGLLETLAQLPHEYDTWLGMHHPMPNGDPATPFAPGTALCGAMITIPQLVPAPFATLKVGEDKKL